MKVLIADKIDQSFLKLLTDHRLTYDYLPEITPVQLKTSIFNYHALIVRSRTQVTKELISQAKNLKIIARAGSGVDNIDLSAAKAQKIIVVNAPEANSQAVAEMTVGLMLSLLRNFSRAFSSMKEGFWLKKELSGGELAGKTVGILGYGRIGKKVARLVEAFGAKVIISSRSYQTVSYKDLFIQSDLLTIHLALAKETKGCVTKWLLNLMKPTAFLINTSRGEIIVEEDLYQALLHKKIAGAALDVFWQEPLPSDSPWRKLENVILTPHLSASTKEATALATKTVIEEVIRVLKGEKPLNQL